MQSIITKFTPHINGALMTVLHHLFTKINNFINFGEFLRGTLVNGLTLMNCRTVKIPRNTKRLPHVILQELVCYILILFNFGDFLCAILVSSS